MANNGGRWRARTADLLLVSTAETDHGAQLRTVAAGQNVRVDVGGQARTTATAR